MAYLSYRDDQLRGAIERFSPSRQLLFGLSLCERLIALHAISADPTSLRSALDAVWNQLVSSQAIEDNPINFEPFILNLEALQQETSQVGPASRSIAQESRHALLTLIESAEHPANRLEDMLTILRVSREAVELLAFENLKLVSWDKWADEKTRIHPLVQGELNAIFSDLRQIWELPDNPEGYQAFRERLDGGNLSQ